ncbi:type III-A CRISPR-associated CARF protein Csm6 [Brachyspira pulli]|uniref:type III-A CRISPR-associated CARF protein Csm6 n=1 Tax=Brachyspira pulli TaxID=310721 RepID=UPI003005F002
MNNNQKKKYILFSPVGTHDPIGVSILKDGTKKVSEGSMLHIIRHYKPEIVYLYITKELNKNDNRYKIAIEKFHPECKKVEEIYGEVENVNSYDAFIDEFKRCIKQINDTDNKDGEYEILLNISSGTPQMKSDLVLEIITNNIYLTPIQVSTPERAANFKDNFSFDLLDKIDISKEENDIRCTVPEVLSFRRAKIQSQIESLAERYEYSSALTLINNDKRSKQLFSDDLIKYLEHGALRMNLQYDKANEIIKLDEKNYNNECIEFIEYYYVMKIKQSKLELSDFILRMSPFLTFILFYFLRKNVAALNRVLENINGDKKIRVNASPDQNFINYMNRRVKNLQDGDFITFYILISMYDFYAKNNQKLNSIIGKKLLDELRDIEREIRNDVAHKMINIDEEFIKDKVKMSSKDILLKCEKILKSVFPEFDTNYFVYDDINNRIREVLQK